MFTVQPAIVSTCLRCGGTGQRRRPGGSLLEQQLETCDQCHGNPIRVEYAAPDGELNVDDKFPASPSTGSRE